MVAFRAPEQEDDVGCHAGEKQKRSDVWLTVYSTVSPVQISNSGSDPLPAVRCTGWSSTAPRVPSDPRKSRAMPKLASRRWRAQNQRDERTDFNGAHLDT